MTGITIAPTTQAQLTAVLAQARVTFEEHRKRYPKKFPDATMVKLEERHKDAVNLAGDRPLSFVAQIHGQPSGFVLLRPLENSNDKAGMIYDIGVFPEARRQGIGQALLHHAASTARSYDWDLLFATVWRGNEASHQLFNSVGFQPQKPLFGVLSKLFSNNPETIYLCNLKTFA